MIVKFYSFGFHSKPLRILNTLLAIRDNCNSVFIITVIFVFLSIVINNWIDTGMLPIVLILFFVGGMLGLLCYYILSKKGVHIYDDCLKIKTGVLKIRPFRKPVVTVKYSDIAIVEYVYDKEKVNRKDALICMKGSEKFIFMELKDKTKYLFLLEDNEEFVNHVNSLL